MRKLKVGVVGAGKISEVLHIPNTILSEYTQLVAIADPSVQRLEYFKKKLEGQKVRFYEDYQQMLEKEEIDSVIVAVPNALHAKVSIAALEKG